MKQLTLGSIAERIGARLVGDTDYVVTGLATLSSALPNHLSFLSNMKYKQQLATTRAGAVILHPDQAYLFSRHRLLLDNPYVGYAKFSQLFAHKPYFKGIDKTARIDSTAILGRNVNLAAGTVIGPNVRLGDNVTLGPNSIVDSDSIIGGNTNIAANVTIYHNIKVGNNCIIHSSAVIGADGFGFAREGSNWVKIAQLGGVMIGDNVEIGAGTTIDRGALSCTIIGNGVKLDNQIQIGHNVELGDHTAIAGCSAIAGSTKLGKYCTVAGACGIVGHLNIADGVHITAMSRVTNSIAKAGVYSSGTALDNNKQWRRNATLFKQLDRLVKRIKQLETNIFQLGR
jgi:UDP-3-O-[3-hydroxymyristoyl] glucosamine N-acyltransferase